MGMGWDCGDGDKESVKDGLFEIRNHKCLMEKHKTFRMTGIWIKAIIKEVIKTPNLWSRCG